MRDIVRAIGYCEFFGGLISFIFGLLMLLDRTYEVVFWVAGAGVAAMGTGGVLVLLVDIANAVAPVSAVREKQSNSSAM